MPSNNTSREFSYSLPITYKGVSYPSAPANILTDGQQTLGNVFADANGNYFVLGDNGTAKFVMPVHTLDEVVVTPSKENLLSAQFNEYLTQSNDQTQVFDAPHREYNPHLKNKVLQGARYHAAWEKEHPNLSAWSQALSAVPFAVASVPLVGALGQSALATTAGQTARAGITSLMSNPIVEAANTGLGLGFAAKGAYDVSQGEFTPETALEILPLTQAVKPIANVTKKLGDAAWHSTYAQYPRYYAGKLYYGTDVEIPTLYRKINSIPIIKDGKVQITTPNNRFAYTSNGEKSPIITNMTTDVPVRSHNGGNWDSADVLAFSGKITLKSAE